MSKFYTTLILALFVTLGAVQTKAQCEYNYGYIGIDYWDANGTYRPTLVAAGDVIYLEAYFEFYDVQDFPMDHYFPIQISTDAGRTWTTVAYCQYLYGPYDDGYGYIYGWITGEFTLSNFGYGKNCYIRVGEELPDGSRDCLYAGKNDWYADGPFEIKAPCVTPTIFSQPTNVTGCEGSPLTMTVNASSNPGVITYEWYCNGGLAATTGTPSYTIASVAQSQHQGTWYVKIKDACGLSANTSTYQVTIQKPAQITAHPTGKTLCDGQQYSLAANATGSLITYQWYKNNMPINGATGNSYLIGSAKIIDEGTYFVVAKGACGKPDTSQRATIIVAAKPVFTQTPVGGLFCPGATTTLNGAATGSTLTYQWYKDNQPIQGANKPSFTLANMTSDDKGFYWVHVSVPGSAQTGCNAESMSDRVYIGVHGAPTISAQPQSVNACEGTTVNLTVSVEGSDLHYKWFKDGNPINNSDSYQLELINAKRQHSGVYTVEITGVCGFTASSQQAVVSVVGVPVITAQPADKTADVGKSVTFNVTADNAQEVVWMHDDQILSRGTATSLTIPSVQLSDEGFYRVVINSACGSVTSKSARLTVVDPASQIPTITISSPSLDAGRVPFGYSRETTFDALVRNGGNVPITVNGFSFSGPNASDFIVTAPVANTLNKGESLTVKIKFTPSFVGTSSATLNVQSTATAGTSSVGISGSGVVLYSVNRKLDFGTVDKGEVRLKCFTITNPTAADIAINAVTVGRTSAAQFGITTTLPLTVSAGSTAEVCAEFKPVNPGSYTADLLITSADAGNTTVVATGTCEIAASVTDAYSVGMSAYPNPASGTVTISTGSTIATSVTILDARGNVVTTLYPTSTSAQWNLTSSDGNAAPSGMYTIVVAATEGSYFMKLNVIR